MSPNTLVDTEQLVSNRTASSDSVQVVTKGRRIEGVGPDQEVEVTARGGKHSSSPYRADCLPPAALLDISKVLKEGAMKYGVDNWRKINRRDHINHALVHILAYLAGDTQDDHLSHAACRVLFAMETDDTEE